MTTFNVHIYREMRLKFEAIEADTPEAAAAIARDKLTSDAAEIDDCEGESLSALVDVKGDEEYEHSRFIDFEAERHRKAAPKLLRAVRMAEHYLADDLDEDDKTEMRIFKAICDARAEADAAGITPAPAAPRLLDALRAVLPYAEAERASLQQCWKRDDDAKVKEELDACDRALDQAAAAIAEANAVGIPSNPAEIDVHALLAARRQIAAIWSIADVQEMRPDLTEDQCWEVLQQARRQHDAEIGINWIVLSCHADMLQGDAPDCDEPGEE